MKKLVGVSIVCLLFVCSAPALALTVVHATDNSNVVSIAGILDYYATGATMAGMQVTVEYIIGDETRTWTATTDQAGHAIDDQGWRQFELAQSGDTWDMSWTLSNDTCFTYITKLTIDALAGNTVFDIGGPADTPGSASGMMFEVTGGNYGQSQFFNDTITATYKDLVAVGGTAYGDLYGTLELAFCRPLGNPFAGGNTLQFIADTDRVVPEPGTVFLLGTGVIGLVVMGRKHLLKK